MTENEAIRDLQYLIGEYSAYPPETGVNATVGSLQYCITALKEIQQYREIGASPERITELILEGSAAKRILGHYQKIGTVEECWKAVGKQKAKKPDIYTDTRNMVDLHGNVYAEQANVYLCPTCESFIGYVGNNIFHYCPVCGQAIDENLEGMEE